MEKITDRILVKVTASFLSSIGYGFVYKCRVIEKTSGNLQQKDIRLTVLTNDKSKHDFLASHPEPEEFEMSCKRKKENEPYALMPITGFVDDNKTSWEVEYFREIPPATGKHKPENKN